MHEREREAGFIVMGETEGIVLFPQSLFHVFTDLRHFFFGFVRNDNAEAFVLTSLTSFLRRTVSSSSALKERCGKPKANASRKMGDDGEADFLGFRHPVPGASLIPLGRWKEFLVKSGSVDDSNELRRGGVSP